MPDKPGIIVKKCAQCDQWFTSNEDLSIRDGKAFHPSCVPNYQLNKEIQQFKANYPYLSDDIITSLIQTTGYENSIVSFDAGLWIIITQNPDNETFAHTAVDQAATEQFISDHHENMEEGNHEIIQIWHDGQEYNHSVSVTAAVTQA